MSDVKLEHQETLTREEAAAWLHVLARAFARGGEAALPVGATKVELRLPERVDAEFEVEVDGDEVELEIELTWSTARQPEDPEDSAPAPGSGATPR